MKAFVAALAFASGLLSLADARPFDLQRDTVHFANETAWAYEVDEAGHLQMSAREHPAVYARSCFLLTRAVLQFHHFAHFDPKAPRVSREGYRALIRKISRIPVWRGAVGERVVIPGFRDLRAFGMAYEGLLKENLGHWLPTYFRVGNYRMALGHPRSGQAMVARWLRESVEAGRPRALYLSRFPHLNHAVLAYAVEPEADGNLRFLIYDPNYPGTASWLRYVAARQSFDLQKRWYFPGGQVNAMRIFLSPLH